jgi:hypothetical protein
VREENKLEIRDLVRESPVDDDERVGNEEDSVTSWSRLRSV